MPPGVANFPLQFLNPIAGLPTNNSVGNTLPRNRCYRAYPGIEYNIRCAVIGGVRPFSYSLTVAPSGMSINPSTGEITWPNPTTSGSPHSVTARVQDDVGSSLTVSWTITVTTSGFIFVDAVGGNDANSGTIGSPLKTIEGFFKNDWQDSTFNGYFVYFRNGTYNVESTDLDSSSGGTRLRFDYVQPGPLGICRKPHVWIGYPGERPVFACVGHRITVFPQASDDWYMDNMEWGGADNNWNARMIEVEQNRPRQVFRRMKFTARTLGSIGGNPSDIYIRGHAAPNGPRVFQDLEFVNHSGIYFCILVYGSSLGTLFEDIDAFQGMGGGGALPIGPKQGMENVHVTGCKLHLSNADSVLWMDLFNQPPWNTSGRDVEICFNDIRCQDGLDRALEVHSDGGSKVENWHVWRNTIVGRIWNNNLVVTDDITYYDNIIENAESGLAIPFIGGDGAGYPDQVIESASPNHNLKGTPGTYVDSNNLLIEPHRSTWLGLKGHETGIPSTPVANFTSDVTSGPAPLDVQFTDTSSGAPTSWLWDFGDTNTSALQHPLHTYASDGTYTVNLTATNAQGSDVATKVDYITVASVTIPNAPTSLYGVEVTDTQIDLTWVDASANEDGFKVRRSLDNVVWSEIAVLGADVQAYSDTTAVFGVSYYYRVFAYNAAGEAGSNTVFVTPVVPGRLRTEGFFTMSAPQNIGNMKNVRLL